MSNRTDTCEETNRIRAIRVFRPQNCRQLNSKAFSPIVFWILLAVVSATGAFGQNILPNQGCGQEGNSRSQNGNTATSIIFINNTLGPISIYWLDYNGQRVLLNILAANGSYTQPTFVTHPWVITGEGGRCEGIFLPTVSTGTVAISPVLTFNGGEGLTAEFSNYSLANYVEGNAVSTGDFCFSLKNTSPQRLPPLRPVYLTFVGFINNGFYGAVLNPSVTGDFVGGLIVDGVGQPFITGIASNGYSLTNNYPRNGIPSGGTASFCMKIERSGANSSFTLNQLKQGLSVGFSDGTPELLSFIKREKTGFPPAYVTVTAMSDTRMCFSVYGFVAGFLNPAVVTGIGFDFPGISSPFGLNSIHLNGNPDPRQLFSFSTTPHRLRYAVGDLSGRLDFGFLTGQTFAKGLIFNPNTCGTNSPTFCVSGNFTGLQPIDVLNSAVVRFDDDWGITNGPARENGCHCTPEGSIFCGGGIRGTVASNPR